MHVYCLGGGSRTDGIQIRHIMLRTAGTLMVRSRTQDHRISTTGSSEHLLHAIASPGTLRRDVFLGLGYNILYFLLANLISAISSSPTWNILSHIIAASLLSSSHLRWTCTILSLKRPAQTRILSLPRRELILPSVVYGLAYQVTAKLPTYIARMGDGYRGDEIGSIAVADAVVLVAAFGLRVSVLYPAFAAYIHTEITQVDRMDSGAAGSDGQEGSLRFGAYAYGRAYRLCFRRTAIWFGLLHLQMVFVLAGFEILVTPLIYKMIF